MPEMAARDPSPHQVHDLIDVDVGVGSSSGLGLVLEVIQELQAREIFIKEAVIFAEEEGCEDGEGQALLGVVIMREADGSDPFEGLEHLLAEALELVAVTEVVVLYDADEQLRPRLNQITQLHIYQQVRTDRTAILQQMSEILYELTAATNFAETAGLAFNRPTRSLLGWESTEFAVPPIDLLLRLEALSFVTELYLHPKRGKYVRLLELLVSEDNNSFSSIAKVFDLTDAVRIEISARCRYLKLRVLGKEADVAASIDLLRIYGHPYFKYQEDALLHSQKRQQVDQLLLQHGFERHDRWEVDSETLLTLHDLARLKAQLSTQGDQERLKTLLADFRTVLKLGEQIKALQLKKQKVGALDRLGELKDIDDQIKALGQRRDFYDEKYETQRFERMIALEDNDNRHDELLKGLLERDRQALQEERRAREQQARKREGELEKEFQEAGEEGEWWKEEHELEKAEEETVQKPVKKPTVQKTKPKEEGEEYRFRNPYVYNQGDADMEKYLRPLLGEFGGEDVADPELLRKYEQLEYLDVLGAKIWISAHSQNWRQRAAAVQAVLRFAQDKLPARYSEGKTRNLFLALMEFARINAEDKVLQIYYTSLKLMTTALQPPICGEDVPTTLINRSIQKFMAILVDKISEMNARAKEVSLKQLITIFRHPAADLTVAVNECLKVCREELNVRFVPVDKQNPRIVLSRLQIMDKLLAQFRLEKRKVDFREILTLLIQGALHHVNSEVRSAAVRTLEQIHKVYPQGTAEWFKDLKGLKPNIAAQLQQKLGLA